MAWNFEIKSNCKLFATAVAEAAPNSEHEFLDDGRHEPVPDTPGIVRTDHVSALIGGSSTTSVYGWEPYESSDFAHDSPQWPGKQTGPYFSNAFAKAGPEGCTYLCFSAAPGIKLDYEVFQGPHSYRTPDDRETFIVCARGQACIGGIGHITPWEIHEVSPKFQSVAECMSGNSIVFYIWQR